jgi:predicted transcriptional regulator
MSVATVVEVPISQTVYQRLKRRAEEENRDVTDVIEEALIDSEERREAFRRMGEAMERSQAAAILNGTSEMTMEEINEEIALARREAELLRKSA